MSSDPASDPNGPQPQPRPLWSAAQDLGWEAPEDRPSATHDLSRAVNTHAEAQSGDRPLGSPLVAGLHLGIAAVGLGVCWWVIGSTGTDPAQQAAAYGPHAGIQTSSSAPPAPAPPPPVRLVEAATTAGADRSGSSAAPAPRLALIPKPASTPAPAKASTAAPAPRASRPDEPTQATLAGATRPPVPRQASVDPLERLDVHVDGVVWTRPRRKPIEAQLITAPAASPAKTRAGTAAATSTEPNVARADTAAARTATPAARAQRMVPSGPDPEATPTVVPAPATPPVAATPAPRGGRFFGLPAGRRTVYVLDASGSLIDTLPFALAELRRALASLTPQQQYAVVFFQGSRVVQPEPRGMQTATPRNVQATLDWLAPTRAMIHAAGRTDARDALDTAFAMQPDTVVLLSDGITGLRDPNADRRALVSLIEQQRGAVQLHTVQWIDPAPLSHQGHLGTLELLSALTHGQHRHVTLSDVRPRPLP